MSVQDISNIIFNIKEKLTDNEFKEIMDNLMVLNKQTDSTENILVAEFYKQQFYHLPHNNNCFYFHYMNEDNTLFTNFEYDTKRMKVGDTFLYEKVFNYIDGSINENVATIVRINPKYLSLIHI